MSEISVSVPGAGRMARDLDRAAEALDVDALVEDVADPIARRAQLDAPKDTGAMARSIRATSAGVVVDVDTYPLMIHFGTRYIAATPFITRNIRPAEVAQLADEHLATALNPLEGASYA